MVESQRANEIQFKGVVESRDDVKPLLIKPGDGVLVVRKIPRLFILLCPSGCGEEVILNLDPRVGPAWRFYKKRGKITLYPSVIRESGCYSHFIVWYEKIYWCDYEDLWGDNPDNVELDKKTLERLEEGKPLYYFDVAENISELPWEVLLSFRRHVRTGKAIEGFGKNRGIFKKK
jgi:hypothetical protein